MVVWEHNVFETFELVHFYESTNLFIYIFIYLMTEHPLQFTMYDYTICSLFHWLQ